MSRFALSALVLLSVAAFGGCPGGAVDLGGGTVAGGWNVVLTLVDGSQDKFEVWQITEQNGAYTLTTDAGSITGTLQGDGSVFFYYEGSDPRVSAWGVNNILQIEINCAISSDGAMIGTVVDRIYVANGLGIIDPTPSTESWKFRATRA